MIIAVGIVGAICWIYQFIYLVRTRMKVAAQLKDLDHPQDDNPLGRVLLAFKGDPARIEEDAEIAELRLDEAIVREMPKLERFQAFLRLAVAAGPLLGLIGTVIGMIITFQSITESGSSDPKLMANGISQAMIATVLGLGIAIPLLFGNAVLSALSRQTRARSWTSRVVRPARRDDREEECSISCKHRTRRFVNLVDGGGPFVFLIFVSGVIMWTLVIERTWFFWKVLPTVTQRVDRRVEQAQRSPVVVRAADPRRDDLAPELCDDDEPAGDAGAGADGAVARARRYGQRDARGIRFDGAARFGGRAHDGDRRVARDALHDVGPRGQHHRVVAGVVLHESGQVSRRTVR